MTRDRHLPWIERLINDAQKAGDFDDLFGSGKPIAGLERTYEPAWWARSFIERERAGAARIALAIRIRGNLPRVLAQRDESSIRRQLREYNDEIDGLNSGLEWADRLEPLDVDRILLEWSARHS